MGLFSGSKKVYVSSSVYNLAGEEINRPNFLKSSLFSAVINPYDAYIGETIVGNYMSGPGILQRLFFNYAVRENLAGVPTFSVRNSVDIEPSIVSPFIPLPFSPADLENVIQSSLITDGDFTIWAEKYILENYPEEADTGWTSDYSAGTHEIVVQFVSGNTVTFPAGNFDKNKQFIVAKYYQVLPAEDLGVIQGTLYTDVLYPDTTGYTFDGVTNTGVVSYNLNKLTEITKEYSDGRPNEFSSSNSVVSEDFNGTEEIYSRTDYIGGNGTTETKNLTKILYVWELKKVIQDNVGTTTVETNTLPDGTIETVTTVVTGDVTAQRIDWREDTQETVLDSIQGDNQIWIYEIGTGNATLDALQSEVSSQGVPEYYPFLPIRLDNRSVRDHPYYDDSTGSGLYKETAKAYKRATRGESIDGLIDEVEANPDIGDIDYSYIQWGVSVNVVERACKRYMYEFFRNLRTYQNASAIDIQNQQNAVANYDQNVQTLATWTAAQTDPANSLYGTPKPVVPSIGVPKSTTVRLRSDHHQLSGFDNRYTWVTIEEELFTGLGKSTAKKGDIWFEAGGIIDFGNERNLEEVFLYKQTDDNNYSRLNIWGMVHENYIYDGKSVRITLLEGINDNETSAFIIPLHAPTVKSLGIKDFTQMSTANTFIIFNSYEVVKKKWYETFIGMLLVIVVVVVVSAIVAPAAIGGASGILGTNAAVGSALGLTGTSAIVAGAVTNTLAAMVISKVISDVSVDIFGEKWGAIIGSIASFAVNFGMANGFGNLNLTTMMNPQNLLSFSSALANGYKGFVAANVADINEQMSENRNEFEKAKKDIEDLMREQGLTNDLMFNPMSLTDSARGNENSGDTGAYVPESLEEFINRTTITGSDIVDITLSMVNNYSELQLTLPK